MKILFVMILFFLTSSLVLAEEKNLRVEPENLHCMAKNNAPVRVTGQRNGANLKVEIEVLGDLDQAKIRFFPDDDLGIIDSPETFEKDLQKGEKLQFNFKIIPKPHKSYLVAQISGTQHNFPRVTNISIPVNGTSSDGHLPKRIFKEKRNPRKPDPRFRGRPIMRGDKPIRLLN